MNPQHSLFSLNLEHYVECNECTHSSVMQKAWIYTYLWTLYDHKSKKKKILRTSRPTYVVIWMVKTYRQKIEDKRRVGNQVLVKIWTYVWLLKEKRARFITRCTSYDLWTFMPCLGLMSWRKPNIYEKLAN